MDSNLKQYIKAYKHKEKWIENILKKDDKMYIVLFGSADWGKFNEKMKLALNVRYLSENGVNITSKPMTEDEVIEAKKKDKNFKVPLCIVDDNDEVVVNDIASFEDATDLGFKEKEKQL